MRETTYVAKPQSPGKNKLPLRKPPMGFEQDLVARLQLLQALQTSLEPRVIIERFWQHCQKMVAVGGVGFISPDGEETRCGSRGVHQCHYQLKGEHTSLGELTFSRNKRFMEDELANLEELLGLLVFPLRNALQYQSLARFSLCDPLTGLGNRAALDTALEREFQFSQRHHQNLSLLMIDLDHFKHINDQHGHATGDLVLKEVAATIHQVCRGSDMSFRFGGEEFIVLLRNTDMTGAKIIAERIRHQVSMRDVLPDLQPTVSIGIGTCTAGSHDHAIQLFERADQALYRAKRMGRNQTQSE